MSTEIFGLIVKPEIGVGDIVATIGLIATAFIFYISYRRTRRNDQLKLFIERNSRMDELYEELQSYANAKLRVDGFSNLLEVEQKKRFLAYLSRFHIIHNELETLTYLKFEKDLSSDLTELIKPGIISILEEMKNNLDTLKRDSVASKLLEETPEDDDFQDLKVAWQFDIRPSKLEVFLSRIKKVFRL